MQNASEIEVDQIIITDGMAGQQLTPAPLTSLTVITTTPTPDSYQQIGITLHA